MDQSTDELKQSRAMENLQAHLQRFSVDTAESATAATLDDAVQEDESSSSSSESSAGLASELHPSDGTRSGPLETLAPTSPVPEDAPVGLLYDQSMEQHLGPDHPERPARIIAVHAALMEQGLMGRCWQLVPRQATDEELQLAHTEEHILKVDSMFSDLYPSRPDTLADAGYCYADGRMGDLYICAGTASAARMAAGCCVQAVRSVLSGAVARAMAVVRPPGHHAECERAQGFCFFNNVAVAALVALQQPGVRRVAVLDWDVHHGNGIQHVLLQRPDAMYISLHRDPKRFYPYTSGFLAEAGEGPGIGFNVNVPWLKKGMGDGDYRAAFSLIVEPLLESYQPDLVIVAAGFDAADGDPLGGCKLSPEGYGWMTERLLRFAGGRLVLALEGGYNNRVTAWCAAACVRALLEGRACPPPAPDRDHLWPSEAHNSLKLVYEFQRQHWPVLRSRSWTEAWEAHLKDVHRMCNNVRSKRFPAGPTANGSSNGNGDGAACGLTPSASALQAQTRAASSGSVDGGATAAAESVPSSSFSSGRGASGAAGSGQLGGSSGGGGGELPPPPSLQEAFKARKAARDAAAAVAAEERPAAGAIGAAGSPSLTAAASAANASAAGGEAATAEAAPAAEVALTLPVAAPGPRVASTPETAAEARGPSGSDCATSSAGATGDVSGDSNASSSLVTSVPTHGSVSAAGPHTRAGGGLSDGTQGSGGGRAGDGGGGGGGEEGGGMSEAAVAVYGNGSGGNDKRPQLDGSTGTVEALDDGGWESR